jgi:hypothetical protein
MPDTAPTSVVVALLLSDPGPLLSGIHGERTGTQATRKTQGGATHDGTRSQRALLRRFEAVGVHLSLSLSLPLSLDRLLSLRTARSIALQRSCFSSRWTGRRAGKLPAGAHGWGHGGLLPVMATEASSKPRHGVALRALAKAAKRGKQRRT